MKMNKIINIMDIPKDLNYEGYLWMSDSKLPTVFANANLESQKLNTSVQDKSIKFNEIDDASNPFIIEGQLFCKDTNKSYSVKYIDGKHIVVEYDLNKKPEKWVSDKKDKTFIPHRIEGVSKLKFSQFWKPVIDIDNLCERMAVLQPAALVFVGFEY